MITHIKKTYIALGTGVMTVTAVIMIKETGIKIVTENEVEILLTRIDIGKIDQMTGKFTIFLF